MVAPRGASTALPEAAAEAAAAPVPDLLLALCRRRASTRMQLRVLGLMMAVRMSPTMGMSLMAKSTRAQRSIAARVGAGRPPWTFLAARMRVRALMREIMSASYSVRAFWFLLGSKHLRQDQHGSVLADWSL